MDALYLSSFASPSASCLGPAVPSAVDLQNGSLPIEATYLYIYIYIYTHLYML